MSPVDTPPPWLVLAEVALVFGVFFLQGAWPVPDVNEPYYLGKAIHFWNPEAIPNDAFLNSHDTHKVFYFTFGWLSLGLSPWLLAWFGRLLSWALLAWAWRRLSFAVLPRRWFSVLTAALFVCLLERFHMAGELVVGGVEAKGFAYVLVFLGLEAVVRNRWNRAWLLLGAASAFHVLVGGWSVVAAGVAWLLVRGDRPALRDMWPAVLGGFVLSLPGLVPSLGLTWGVDGDLVPRANEIYVFKRLAHHLVPARLPPGFVDRFLLLTLLWGILEWITPGDAARRRLRMFTAGALAIAGVGLAINLLENVSTSLAAGLLRFYWFRLSDVAVPLAVSLVAAGYVAHLLRVRPRAGRWALAVAVLVAGFHVGGYAVTRPFRTEPRADRHRVPDYEAWRQACAWVALSGQVPPEARFLAPRMSQTFKWYAGRAEVATWKDIPQDAPSVVRWWDTLRDVHGLGSDALGCQWHDSLAELGTARLKQLGAKYEADYVLTVRWPRLRLEVVYENRWYVIYRLPDRSENAMV